MSKYNTEELVSAYITLRNERAKLKEDYEEDDYECITYRLNLSPEDVAADDWKIVK